MDRYIEKNIDIQHIFQDYAAPEDIEAGVQVLTAMLRRLLA